MSTSSSPNGQRFQLPFWPGVVLLAAIAVFFLWNEHQAHLLGVLPWLILLACPVIHLLMHRGHGHRPRHGPTRGAHQLENETGQDPAKEDTR